MVTFQAELILPPAKSAFLIPLSFYKLLGKVALEQKLQR